MNEHFKTIITLIRTHTNVTFTYLAIKSNFEGCVASDDDDYNDD